MVNEAVRENQIMALDLTPVPRFDSLDLMKENVSLIKIDQRTRQAVAHYWTTRSAQQRKQKESGRGVP